MVLKELMRQASEVTTEKEIPDVSGPRLLQCERWDSNPGPTDMNVRPTLLLICNRERGLPSCRR